MTATAHLLVAVAASFAGAAVAAAMLGGRLSALDRLVPLFAVLAAIGAALADSQATAVPWVDTAGRSLIAAAATLLAASAPPWAVVVAAALVAAGRTWPGAVAGGAALGLAATGIAPRGLRAAVGGATAVAAFHLAWPETSGATAALGIAAIALLTVRRAPLLPVAAAAAAVVAFSAAAGWAALDARTQIDDGVARLRTGLNEAQDGDSQAAAASLQAAQQRFADARDSTNAWWVKPALAVPVVGHHLRAVTAVATSGDEVAATGILLADAIEPGRLTVDNGRLPIDAVRSLQGPAADAVAALEKAIERIEDADSPWLLSMADRRLDDVDDRLRRAHNQAKPIATATRIAPALLGADGPRRYFLAVQTPSELRGSGGFIGNFGEITADNGGLALGRIGRTVELNEGGDTRAKTLAGIADADYLARYSRFDPVHLWQNITASPDFPSNGRAIAGLYPQSGGRPVDGVIAIDPHGLAALLQIVGPVTVPDWPQPITAASAARVLLHEQYLLDRPTRLDFLESVTDQVWRKLLAGRRDVADVARITAPAVAGKHIVFYSTRPDEQAALQTLRAAGAMAPVRPGHDFLGLVTQNAGGNKIDWFLRRSVDYRVDGDRATVTVTLRNEAPAKGLPDYVIGNVAGLPVGTNKAYVSIYTPRLLDKATLNGAATGMESERELGRNVYSAFVVIPPGGTTTLELQLEGGADATSLDLFRQPAAWPDEVTVGDQTLSLERDTTVRLRR